MIEVFITNIPKKSQAEKIVKLLKKEFPTLTINYDMNETGLPFPCGHTVLRVEGVFINAQKILSIVHNQGALCEVMKDKICA